MPGLRLSVGGFGGPMQTGQPAYGTSQSYAAPVSVHDAAFGPGGSMPAPDAVSIFTPNDAYGIAFTAGVLAIVALAWIRWSLPR